jgi:hypothetical protein
MCFNAATITFEQLVAEIATKLIPVQRRRAQETAAGQLFLVCRRTGIKGHLEDLDPIRDDDHLVFVPTDARQGIKIEHDENGDDDDENENGDDDDDDDEKEKENDGDNTTEERSVARMVQQRETPVTQQVKREEGSRSPATTSTRKTRAQATGVSAVASRQQQDPVPMVATSHPQHAAAADAAASVVEPGARVFVYHTVDGIEYPCTVLAKPPANQRVGCPPGYRFVKWVNYKNERAATSGGASKD